MIRNTNIMTGQKEYDNTHSIITYLYTLPIIKMYLKKKKKKHLKNIHFAVVPIC